MAAGSDNEKTPLSTGSEQQLDNLPPESKSPEMSPIVKPTPESGKLNDAESLKDPNTPVGVTESDKKENVPEKLDVEIIEILGEDPLAEDPQVGVLHSEVATRWSNLISNGLKKELKSDLLAKYSRASNCQLEAQTLNPEVAASMQNTAVKRDKFACEIQNIIGFAMLALGKGISLMLEEKEDGVDRMELLKYISDSGRLLAEAHHKEAMTRRSFILPGMDKNIKEVLEKSKLDKFLFGEDLSEKIKSTKSIVKVAAEIKTKPQSQRTALKTANQGNWKAPSSKMQWARMESSKSTQQAKSTGSSASKKQFNSRLGPS
ncbi:uncharacterized protein LOC123271876 [Cotesia glomerata]|uniref:uncharacterized protein LOC123271876 n=1 Tax=Cotesia glomerata TaxID=32391 RepID=UPI001D0318C7|nr:uncharacterized protein LOC123271876 [Cotesia glomerata]